MTQRQPSVSITNDGLIIRIPWNTVDIPPSLRSRRKRRLTSQDVLELVEAGRLAHRLGKTRLVHSLKDLFA